MDKDKAYDLLRQAADELSGGDEDLGEEIFDKLLEVYRYYAG